MTIQDAVDLICVKEPFFSSLVMSLKMVEDDTTPTMGTDGENLYYNKKFLESLTTEETCGVLLHETLHCAFSHLWRRGDREHTKWNMATDYAINLIVNESFKLPTGTLLDTKYVGMSAEEIYDELPPSPEQQSWCEKDRWKDNKDQPGKKGSPSIIDRITGKVPKKGTMSESAKEQKWKRIFEENVAKQYGKAPDSVKRLIEKDYFVPVIDWASLVSQLLSEDTNDYTFAQPDRRFLEADYLLPGLHSVDRLKDVVFAYDTSGSISRQDLHAFYVETMNLFNNFSSLQGWVAICDAYLHSFKPIDNQSSYDEFSFIGGGGTDFNPVFDEIAKKNIRPKALFYFTDTQGDFPSEDPGYPVFWLVRSQVGDNYDPYVPFGTVIKFLPK